MYVISAEGGMPEGLYYIQVTLSLPKVIRFFVFHRFHVKKNVGRAGLEPATDGLRVRCSAKLSQRPG